MRSARPIPENGNVVRFADLRPDLTVTDIYGVEVVAYAIFEYPTMQRQFFPDEDGNLILPSGRRIHPEELPKVEERELGEATPTTGYCVLELDAHGQVVDDWEGFSDLEDAIHFLRDDADETWKELPQGRDEAVAAIQKRLAEPPQRP